MGGLIKAIIIYILVLLFCGFVGWKMVDIILQNPTNMPAYVGLLFIVSVVFFLVYYPIKLLSRRESIYKPKTISKILLLWFILGTAFCSGGALLLYGAYFNDSAKIEIVLAFAIVFSVLALPLLIGVFVLIIEHLRLKHLLKTGTETTAKFIAYDFKNAIVEYTPGVRQLKHIDPLYWIEFTYKVDKRVIKAKSKAAFTEKEAHKFKELDVFKIKYKGNKVIISEILN